MPPAPGVISNFKDPESHAYEGIVATSVCLSLMMPFFAMRMYSRASRNLGGDDCKVKAMLRSISLLTFVKIPVRSES